MPSSPHPPPPPPPTTIEADLLTHLASTTALEDIHSTLLSTLQRTGWTERIRKLATELLRAGRCERFDEVVDAVVATAEGRIPSSSSLFLDDQNYAHSQKYDHDNETENGGGGGGEDIDVRIPSAVVEQGVRAIKEVLREVAVRDDESDLLDGSEDGSSGSEPSGKGKREETSGRGNGNGNSFEGTSGREKKKGKGKSGR
ncbi:hypothetical protein P168DRAFT_293854 [Aspergillus campestris IBT 28561]|uniref:Uncharacterized protein n=1 Tax=Aspergillus campestris (strain IBT 28561) TaxID=1392248 RepID=A0A2I1CQT2_ASPC2|nr:uncharacterized protein P168DRAFT_293854 [Aspergillus campestris IBT 28561]PKX99972.1 hypothetical protein P168DRAFT_293854 [Aspergillus campestris IBT 28561]